MVESMVAFFGWLTCFVGTVLGFSSFTSSERRSFALPFALALGACAVVPDLLGRALGSLVPGLLLLGGTGWTVFGITRRRPQVAFGVGVNAAAVAVIALAALVLATLSLHDRIIHIAFTGAAARGVLPLQHPFFPGEPLAYHVGFDVVAGGLVELGGLALGTAVGVAHALSVSLMIIALKELLPQTRFLWLLPLLAHGPLAVGSAAGLLPGSAFDFGFGVNESVPPPFSNLMQPPQGLGLALAFSLLLLGHTHTRRGRSLLGIGFAFLAQAHLVVFLIAGFGIAVGTVFEAARMRDARVLKRLFGPLIAFVGWIVFGSFGPSSSSLLEPGGFFGAAALKGVLVFLPAAVLALVLFLRRVMQGAVELIDVVLVASGVAGMTVFLLFHYELSWDIVKFGSVASFFLTLLLARSLTDMRQGFLLPTVALLSMTTVVWMVSTVAQNVPRHPGREGPGEQFLERFGDEVAGPDCVATRANAISAAGVLTVSSPLELADNLVINRALITHQQELFLRFERDGDMHALVELGCRYLFRPADAPHREQVEQAMEPMGNMTVGASPWTLYRFK